MWEIEDKGDCVGDGGQRRLCGRWRTKEIVWEMEDKGDCVGDGGRSVVECGDGGVCMAMEHDTSTRWSVMKA